MASARFSALLCQVRNFSASAARSNLVQTPIQVFGVEGRYASALYSAATKKKVLDSVEAEVNKLSSVLSQDTALNTYINDPTIKRTDKKDTLQQALGKQKYSDITTNFVLAMAENGRLRQMKNIFGTFSKIMAAHRGEVVCTVTTAKPLDKSNLKELEAALKLFLKPGEILLLDTKVDPALIGGMVVNIGDKYVDMSMASKIKTYTTLIQAAV